MWDWVSHWYRPDYYQTLAATGEIAMNPKGPSGSFDPNEPECRRGCSAVGHFFAPTSTARDTPPADEARENSTPERITSAFAACAMFRQNETNLKQWSARYNTAALSTADD